MINVKVNFWNSMTITGDVTYEFHPDSGALIIYKKNTKDVLAAFSKVWWFTTDKNLK